MNLVEMNLVNSFSLSCDVELQFSPNLIRGKIESGFSCFHFQNSLSKINGFTSTSTQHHRNVLHATLITVVVSTATSKTEKHSKINK